MASDLDNMTYTEFREGALARGDFDPIPPGELGESREHPYLVAPADWHENGVPYGAWFKCSTCGLVSRSTIAFDCRASKPGQALIGDCCAGHSGWRYGAPEQR